MHRLAKLRRMSLAEVRWRLARAWQIRADRRQYRRGGPSPAAQADAAVADLPLASRAAAMLKGASAGQWTALEERDLSLAKRIQAQARRHSHDLLHGTVELLGHSVCVADAINWQRDPRSSYNFPRTFFADVKLYELPQNVDVKHVWELNRQQWLVDLARAWRADGNEQGASRARTVILDWIDKNPYREGVNWTSGLEVAMRAISWFWTIALTADAPCWRPDDERRIASSLAEHADYLEHHFSLYSSPYNHLIGETTALLLLGHWLAPLPHAERWREASRQVLETHGPRQFYDDGFSVEQATGYHFFTLALLLQAALVARQAGQPLTAVERALPVALRAGAVMCQPDGRWPAIGDLDSARAVPLSVDDFWDFRSLCGLGAVVCGEGSLKELSGEPGEEIFWLLGCQGLDDFANLAAAPRPHVALLPSAGYVAARSTDNRDWLLFDVGPLGGGVHTDGVPSVAHGHADVLSVWLYWQGRPTLVDSGMPSYSGPLGEVSYYREPAAHSTFEIFDEPVARAAGRLAWAYVHERPATAALLGNDVWLARGRVVLPPGAVTAAEADGFSPSDRLPGRAVMERYLLCIPGEGVWIADRVRTSRPTTAAWYWQMPLDLEPEVVSQGSEGVRLDIQGGVITVFCSGKPLEATVSLPANSPEAWHGTRYGVKVPGRRVSIRATAEGDLVLLTFIGKEPRCASVTLGEITVGKPPAGEGVARDFAAQNAEVLWRVETSSGPRTLLAGAGITTPPTGFTPIAGLGEWPAYKASARNHGS